MSDPLEQAEDVLVESAMRTALANSPVVRNALKTRLPFWIQPAWSIGKDADGNKVYRTLVARSRETRRKGITVTVPADKLEGKSAKEQQRVSGIAIAQALIDLGLGWFVNMRTFERDSQPQQEESPS